MIDLTRALLYSHRMGLVHCDLKAENVFLTKSNQIKLGDFGMAKIKNYTKISSDNSSIDSFSSNSGEKDNFVGTYLYSSPEIIFENKFSKESDYWALGVILYHLCNLELPFYEKSLRRTIKSIDLNKPKPVNPQYSQELRDIINQLLNKDPAKRINLDSILNSQLVSDHIKFQNQNDFHCPLSKKLEISKKSLKNDFENCKMYKNSNFITNEFISKLNEKCSDVFSPNESLVLERKTDMNIQNEFNKEDMNWVRERMSIRSSFAFGNRNYHQKNTLEKSFDPSYYILDSQKSKALKNNDNINDQSCLFGNNIHISKIINRK